MAFEKGDRVRVVRDLKGMFPLVKGDEGVVVRHGRIGPGMQTYLWGVLFDRYTPTTHHYVRSPENAKKSVSILEYVELVSAAVPVAPLVEVNLRDTQPAPTQDDILGLLYRQGFVTQTASGDVVISGEGRCVVDSLIRRDIETHVEYMRILRHSHPDAARLVLLMDMVKRAAKEEGSLDVVEIKLRAVWQIAGGAA